MSAEPRHSKPHPPDRTFGVPEVHAGRLRKTSLRIALPILAFSLIGCASSFCGAPCESGASAAAQPVPPPENHYGTRFGHLDTWNLSPAQLLHERAELESLLRADSGDAALLKALGDRHGGADTWMYDGFQSGGSRFRSSGKLRREVGIEDMAKRVMSGIEESPRRDLFERYRLVRIQLHKAPGTPVNADTAVAAGGDSAGAGESGSLPVFPAPDSVSIAAPDTGSIDDSPAQAEEGPWSGYYRANSGAPSAVPDGFTGLDECKAWAESKAEEYRQEYFAFEFECSRNGRTFKRKMW